MAPPKKPTSRRQRRNTPDLGLAVQATPRAALPPAERRWLSITRERWEAFCSSELVQVVEPATDTPALLRLFGYYDEIERAIRAGRRRQVKARDGYRCTAILPDGSRCEENKDLVAHHLVPLAAKGGDAVENGRTLCRTHHRQVDLMPAEMRESRFFRAASGITRRHLTSG